MDGASVYFEDDGAPPEVPPFHAMNIVPGECLEPLLQEPPADVMPLVPSRAFAAARMLAALHRVDPVAVGLGAEKQTSLEDEIKRWTRAFETVDDVLGGVEEPEEDGRGNVVREVAHDAHRKFRIAQHVLEIGPEEVAKHNPNVRGHA